MIDWADGCRQKYSYEADFAVNALGFEPAGVYGGGRGGGHGGAVYVARGGSRSGTHMLLQKFICCN
jgi:hypothetical protein